MEKSSKLEEKELKSYLESIFINKTFKGLKREEYVIDTFKKSFISSDFKIIRTRSSNYDNSYSVDFFINYKNKRIGIQIKPYSFIVGLKSTTRDSIKRIIKTKKNDLPLYIIIEDNKKIVCYAIKNNKIEKLNIDKFKKYIEDNRKILNTNSNYILNLMKETNV